MLVSLFTDASFHPSSGAAGWGAYAISDRSKTLNGGAIKENCRTNNDAELLAALYGLRMAAAHRILRPKDEVLLQSDSSHVLYVLQTFAIRSDDWSKEVHDRIRKGLAEWNCTLRTRHIKGHSGTGTARTWAHDKCDKLARKGMRVQRDRNKVIG